MNIIGITGHAGSGKDTVADVFVNEYGFQRVAFADPLKKFSKLVFDFTEEQLWGPSHKRNGVDSRYVHYVPGTSAESDSYWTAAEARLNERGREWVHRVINSSLVSVGRLEQGGAGNARELEEREALAFEALVEWFHWLGTHYPSKLSPRVVLQTLGTEWGREKVSPTVWVDYALARAEKKIVVDRAIGVIVSDARLENELMAIKNANGKLIRIRRPETDHLGEKTGIPSHMSETEQDSLSDDMFDFLINNDGSVQDLQDTARVYASCLGLVEVDS